MGLSFRGLTFPYNRQTIPSIKTALWIDTHCDIQLYVIFSFHFVCMIEHKHFINFYFKKIVNEILYLGHGFHSRAVKSEKQWFQNKRPPEFHQLLDCMALATLVIIISSWQAILALLLIHKSLRQSNFTLNFAGIIHKKGICNRMQALFKRKLKSSTVFCAVRIDMFCRYFELSVSGRALAAPQLSQPPTLPESAAYFKTFWKPWRRDSFFLNHKRVLCPLQVTMTR